MPTTVEKLQKLLEKHDKKSTVILQTIGPTTSLSIAPKGGQPIPILITKKRY